MRMWMVSPHLLCRQHLLGEHNELHKHLPSLRKGMKIDGRLTPVIKIEVRSLKSRHEELVKEMKRRNYNHQSPLKDIPDLKKLYPIGWNKKVCIKESIKDLIKRCPNCKRRIKMAKAKDNTQQLQEMTDQYNYLVDKSGVGKHQTMFKHISEAETMLEDIKNKIKDKKIVEEYMEKYNPIKYPKSKPKPKAKKKVAKKKPDPKKKEVKSKKETKTKPKKEVKAKPAPKPKAKAKAKAKDKPKAAPKTKKVTFGGTVRECLIAKMSDEETTKKALDLFPEKKDTIKKAIAWYKRYLEKKNENDNKE